MKKPKVKLTGTDGNVFALLGRCVDVLKKAKLRNEAKELQAKVFKSHSYEEALGLMSDYCEVS